LVFRLFGIYSVASRDRAPWHSVHHRRRHRHHHPRAGPAVTLAHKVGFCAAWSLGAQPYFFPLARLLIWDFTASAFLLSAAFIVTLDVAEKNTRKLWLSLGRALGGHRAHQPALLSVMPFTFLYAALCEPPVLQALVASAALAGVLFVALVSPWLIRNEAVFGRPVFFRSIQLV